MTHLPSLVSCFKPKPAIRREADDEGRLRLAPSQVESCATPRHPGASKDDTPTESSPLSSDCLEALPCSWAVVNRDPCDHKVLDHGFGSEPAAAQVLRSVLQSMSSSGSGGGGSSRNCLLRDSAGSHHGAAPAYKGASSFLSALLGPQMEAAALNSAQMGRLWKGTICMQLPAQRHIAKASAQCSFRDVEEGAKDVQRDCLPSKPGVIPSAQIGRKYIVGRPSACNRSGTEKAHFLSEGQHEGLTHVHTRAFLRSLFDPEDRSTLRSKTGAFQDKSNSALTLSGISEAEVEDSLDRTPGSKSITRKLPHPQPRIVGNLTVHSFDVAVSPLDHSSGSRGPLLVVINNSTEHLEMREVLPALLQSQLDLLAALLPRQCLAMESPEAVHERVRRLAHTHKSATLMFMNIGDFMNCWEASDAHTSQEEVEPVQAMTFLNMLVSHFDMLVDVHGVHKVETADAGCYAVSGGIMKQASDGFSSHVEESHDPAESAHRVMEFAKAVLNVAAQVKMPNTQQPVGIRIGMHTGDVVSGMIGSRLPKFSVLGDAMNTASRMESSGVPGRIHASEATRNLLPREDWEATGGMEVEGKGQMESYLWIPPLPRSSGGQRFDASSSIPRSPEPRTAQRLLLGPSPPPPPFAALSSAIHVLYSREISQVVSPAACSRNWEEIKRHRRFILAKEDA